MKNITDFKDAIRLYYSNDDVANYNFQKLSELQQPIARINPVHSSPAAKKICPEDMSGLEPVIFLAKGGHIMLTMNLWTDVGFCNGATGVVLDFIYADNHQPPLLSLYNFMTVQAHLLVITIQVAYLYALLQ